MKSSEGQVDRVFILRLEDGDIIPECIVRFADNWRYPSSIPPSLNACLDEAALAKAGEKDSLPAGRQG